MLVLLSNGKIRMLKQPKLEEKKLVQFWPLLAYLALVVRVYRKVLEKVLLPM